MKRRRRYCQECLPAARRERALRAIAKARAVLAAQVLTGDDPRASETAGRKRGAGVSEAHRRNREWKRENGKERRDRAWFLRDIIPKLDDFSLTEIARATGLSLAACSRFRLGVRIPHPRHWEALAALVSEASWADVISPSSNRRS